MGNWRNRSPRRRYLYNQDRPPRSSNYDLDPPPHSPSHRGFADDGVPLWEKKFCYLIGSVPWRKVVDSRKYMYCSSNVLNWDDSAGKEAFQIAKDRFWAEINDLPYDTSLPDPNMYIDEINWSPDIDPELIKDLEHDLFALDKGEKDVKVGSKSKKTRNLVFVPSEGCNRHLSDTRNPWEGNTNLQSDVALRDKKQGWHKWDTVIDNSGNVNNDDNPWERSFPCENEAVKQNTWGDKSDKLWAWNRSENNGKQSNSWGNGAHPWDSSCQAVEKNNEWDNFRVNSWGHNCQEPGRFNSGNSWASSCQAVEKNNEWDNFRVNSWDNNCQEPGRFNSGNSWASSKFQATGTSKNGRCWKRRDNASNEPKNVGFRKSGGDWGAWNDVSRKRGGAYQYNSLQKHKVLRG